MPPVKDFQPHIMPDQAWQLLTKREKEILYLIINGYTNSEIAGLLFLSTRTTETHRQNMLSKLGARNTAVLVRYATEKLHDYLIA